MVKVRVRESSDPMPMLLAVGEACHAPPSSSPVLRLWAATASESHCICMRDIVVFTRHSV